MKTIYILKTGTTFTATRSEFNDFEDWIIDKLHLQCVKVVTIDVSLGESLPKPEICDGVIVTGSHSMVTDEEEWSLKAAAWLVELINKEVPLLAICYGHQLLAKALGGVAGYHPEGMEIGTVEITLSEDAKTDILFSSICTNFSAHTIHSQTVLKLPSNSVRLAFNAHDDNHAFRVGRKAWGVQFHPEFDKVVMNSYIKELAKEKAFGKLQGDELLQKSQETPQATSILQKFEEVVCGEI